MVADTRADTTGQPLSTAGQQRRALAAIAGSQLLVLTLWFSASAGAPQLESAWGLTSGQAAGLTIAVQIGFVVGALASALLSVADVAPARRLFVVSALVGAAVNLMLVTLGPGDTVQAFGLTLVTIRGIPWLAENWGWQWAFPILAVGPALGIVAMVALKRSPQAAELAGGAG